MRSLEGVEEEINVQNLSKKNKIKAHWNEKSVWQLLLKNHLFPIINLLNAKQYKEVFISLILINPHAGAVPILLQYNI